MFAKLRLNNKDIAIVWPRSLRWELMPDGKGWVLVKNLTRSAPIPSWRLQPCDDALRVTHGERISQYLFETSGDFLCDCNSIAVPQWTVVEIHRGPSKFHTGVVARYLFEGGELPDINEINVRQVRDALRGKFDPEDLSPLGLALFQCYAQTAWVRT